MSKSKIQERVCDWCGKEEHHREDTHTSAFVFWIEVTRHEPLPSTVIRNLDLCSDLCTLKYFEDLVEVEEGVEVPA